MSNLNKHGNNGHPDLPPCVRCGGDDYSTCSTVLGHGMSLQYACKGCDARVIYRYCGPPGVLVWALSEDAAEWDRLNDYLKARQAYRDAAYTSEWGEDDTHTWKLDPSVPFPVPSAGLAVHRLDGKQWVRLETKP